MLVVADFAPAERSPSRALRWTAPLFWAGAAADEWMTPCSRNTALKSEYTYRNDEALETVFREGRRRYFFFIKDKLWKIMDEMPLRADGPLGGSFQDAVGKLNAAMGVGARIRPADQSQGLDRTTADWQDAKTHVRALDRSGESIVALVLEDKGAPSRTSRCFERQNQWTRSQSPVLRSRR